MGDIGDRGRGGVISSSSPLSLSPPLLRMSHLWTHGRTCEDRARILKEFAIFLLALIEVSAALHWRDICPIREILFLFFPWHWALTSWSLENTPIERPKILVTYDTHIETFLTIIGRLVVINRFYPKCVCRDFHHLRENSKLSFLRQKMQWQRTGSHPLSLAFLAVTHLRQQKSSQFEQFCRWLTDHNLCQPVDNWEQHLNNQKRWRCLHSFQCCKAIPVQIEMWDV